MDNDQCSMFNVHKKMNKANKIAVLIPCLDEARTIASVVADFRAALPEATVYVYDNNSTDDTARVAAEAGAVVRHERRQGKGNVVRSMFRNIDADCYLLVDGDATYTADVARDMCRMVLDEGVDMVIADRLSSNYFDVNSRRLHGSGNRLVRWLVNSLFDSDVHDIMSGYRAMSRLFVKHYPVLSRGFEIETEMTIHALDHNFVVEQLAAPYRERPAGSTSKLNTMSDGLRVLKTIVMLFRDIRPLRFFAILSVLLLLVAVVMLVPVYVEYLHTGLVPRFPTLIVAGFIALLAMLLWVCGLILDVIASKHKQLYELLLHDVTP